MKKENVITTSVQNERARKYLPLPFACDMEHCFEAPLIPALTSRLALELLKLGKVPFYCAAWCNLKSVRNVVKCSFVPAWVELTAREIDFVNEMNRRG